RASKPACANDLAAMQPASPRGERRASGCPPNPLREARKRDGEGGIRTLEAGISPPNALAGRRLQPLGHFSGRSQGYRTVPPVPAGRQARDGRVAQSWTRAIRSLRLITFTSMPPSRTSKPASRG